MAVRNIIQIDEDKCDGCGLCVIGCAEGALKVINGKAKLVSEIYCDGLGACLGECPTGALTVIQRDAEEFDESSAMAHVASRQAQNNRQSPQGPEPVQIQPAPVHASHGQGTLACGCPGSMSRELSPADSRQTREAAPASALRNWPVQLHLVPAKAPYFQDAELLISADCAGFSATNLHREYLPGKTLAIACPKLDETSGYEDKLAEIIKNNHIKSLTVLYMTVPCCFGLVHLVRQAVRKSGRAVPLRLVQIEPTGEVAEVLEEAAS
jgi:NAD-dependent dihydropyrimidine dehydrogenase PreA subunit